jgi:hypothetical protein
MLFTGDVSVENGGTRAYYKVRATHKAHARIEKEVRVVLFVEELQTGQVIWKKREDDSNIDLSSDDLRVIGQALESGMM